jgi:hypothetical protein
MIQSVEIQWENCEIVSKSTIKGSMIQYVSIQWEKL